MPIASPSTKSPFFERNTEIFSEENFALLKGIMYENSYPAESHLFWEGEAADKLYFIKKGQVKVSKSTDDGRDFTLYIFQEGDMFGDISTFGDLKYSFNAEVTQNSVISMIQQKDLEILLWQHGELAVEFMKWMSILHRVTQTKFRDLMLYGKPGALCSTLIRLSNTYGIEMDGTIRINKRINNSELAEMIGATRESVNRMLNDFKHSDILSMEEGCIIIKDLDYLKDICHCENCPNSICRI